MSEADQLYIDRILAHPAFPKHPSREISKDISGKKISEFFIPRDQLYVDTIKKNWHVEPVKAVCGNFTCQYTGETMRYIFYFCEPAGYNPILIVGTEFV